jgi:3-deoxy-7-phosphoheptulonate synthase
MPRKDSNGIRFFGCRPGCGVERLKNRPMSSQVTACSPPSIDSDNSLPVENVRVMEVKRLVTPAQVKTHLPASSRLLDGIREARATARRILSGEDRRLMVVVGPCSIHDPVSAMDYAGRLAALAEELREKVFMVMRVYFEKPRTTVGWKGLINDPRLDDSGEVEEGIHLARKLLLDIAELGLPAGTEFLDPIIPQYIADLISWAAIGARTTESQTHREMASGLSMPVGFKNGTDGSIQTAIDAMRSACAAHSFLGIDQDGMTSIVKTAGNPDSHIVLRGGRDGANYGPEHTAAAAEKLTKAGLPVSLMVDCSHANSGKDPLRQPEVLRNVLQQRKGGRDGLVAVMLESHIHLGTQPSAPSGLKYGVSVTDACLDWEATAALLREI